MEKTYKVITIYSTGDAFIECHENLTEATENYDRTIKGECDYCYLMQENVHNPFKESSANFILKSYKR